MYDIAIIGAGPAGATLAKLIDSRYKVLLIEKRNMRNPEARGHKCCGGLLAPEAQKIMAQLGMSLPKSILVDPQIFTVRTIDLQSKIEQYYQRFYINIDRAKFDCYLASLVLEKVDFMDNCFLNGLQQVEHGYQLNLNYQGNIIIKRTKVVIAANGAGVGLGTYKNQSRKYAAIQEWYEIKQTPPYFSAIFDPEITDYYSWIIPKDNYLLIGSAIPMGKDVWQKFENFKNKLINYGYVFNKRIKKEGAIIYRPISINQINVGDQKIAGVGEAAGLISPSSAEGLSYALKSASYLADALNSDFDNFSVQYKKKVQKLVRNIFLKNIKSSFMYNSMWRKMIMWSGVGGIEVRK
jgi:flavin-dependent dehydrogenase